MFFWQGFFEAVAGGLLWQSMKVFRSSCWQAVVAFRLSWLGVFEAVTGRLSWNFEREQTVASNSQTVASNSQTVASDSETVAVSRQAIVAW